MNDNKSLNIESILEHIPFGLLVTNHSGQIVFANNLAKNYFEYSLTELLSTQLNSLTTPYFNLHQEISRRLSNSRGQPEKHASSQAEKEIILLLKKNGTIFAAEYTLSIYQEESSIYALLTFSPITQLIDLLHFILHTDANLSLEETMQLSTIKNHYLSLLSKQNDNKDYLGTVLHDLRTPLHSILNFSDFGIKKHGQLTPEKTLKYFQNVHSSSQFLQTLITALCDISKLEHGNFNFQNVSENFLTMINQLKIELAPLLQLHNQQLEIKTATTAKNFTCNLDKEQIMYALTTIIYFAVTINKASNLSILLSNTSESWGQNQQRDFLVIAITSQGIVIAATELATIFEKFNKKQYDTESTQKQHGLELAIAKAIILAQQGYVSITTESPSSVIFTIKLPLIGS